MKYLVLSMVALIGCTSLNIGGAAAEEPTPQTHVTDTKTGGGSNQKICRRDSAGTGSIMPKRICHTQAEWTAIEAAGKRDLERVQGMDRARSMISSSR